MNLVIKNRNQKMPSQLPFQTEGSKGLLGTQKSPFLPVALQSSSNGRPPASWRLQEHQELYGGGKERMDITSGDPRDGLCLLLTWTGWTGPPCPANPPTAAPVLSSSSFALSLLPGFGVLSGLFETCFSKNPNLGLSQALCCVSTENLCEEHL